MEKYPGQEKPSLVTSRIEGPQDFDKIMEIQKNDGFEHAYYLTSDRLEKLIERGEEFFIVCLDSKPVAFASVDMEIRAKLHFFSVDKDNINKGIGTELLEKTIAAAASRDYEKIHVFVEADSPVEKFLIKNEFENVGSYKNRYGKGKDAHILEREIKNSEESI